MASNDVDDGPRKRVKVDDASHPRISSQIGLSQPNDCDLQDESGQNDAESQGAMTTKSKELAVGITAFVSEDRPTFYGVLKKRYTDFLVNEILPDGRVLHLRETSYSSPRGGAGELPKHEDSVQRAADDEHAHQSPSGKDNRAHANGPSTESVPAADMSTKTEISDEDRGQLALHFDEKTVDDLIALDKDIISAPKKKARDRPIVRTAFTSDRSVRAQIHQDIRRIFNHRIDSSTDKDGILVLSAASPSNRKRESWGGQDGKSARPGKLAWLDRGGEHLHFTLYKENKDTMEVISFLTKLLKTNSKTFQFAGTKDRRAVTVQRVSGYRVQAEHLAAQNRNLKNAAVGDFQYQSQGLALGDLKGNEFVITLRDCQIVNEDETSMEERISSVQEYLAKALQNLRDQGFLNYYGLQRFGTFSTRTDTVGLKILQGDFQAACDALLEFNPAALAAVKSAEPSDRIAADNKARAEAISIWRTKGRVNEVLDKLPRKFSAETAVIRSLGKHPQDFLGALMMIPRNLRLMYVHAYQSLIWNLAVGERWKLFGDQVVAGDLVLVHEHQDKVSGRPVQETVDADGEVVIRAADDDRANSADDVFERARVLTPEEVAHGTYSIFDVVLPLPGFDVIYPANASGDFYQTLMASERGGRLDPYDMRRKQKDFSLSGSYRKLIARIGPDYSVHVHQYADEDEQFVRTDMDDIRIRHTGGDGVSHEMKDASTETEGSRHGDKLAAVLQFQLGSSQYATVALRELSQGGVQAHQQEYSGGR